MSTLLVQSLPSGNARLSECLELHHGGSALEMIHSIEKFLRYEHDEIQNYSGRDIIQFLILAVTAQRHYGSTTQIRQYERKLLNACKADRRFEYNVVLAETNRLTAATRPTFDANLHTFFRWMSHVRESISRRFGHSK